MIRTLLIVSPHFPPINAPDMQRVRMSLPHLAAFGWRPVVLTVKPEHVEGVSDPLLLETIPFEVPIHRVSALPARWTRNIGLGNVGLRAMPFLYRAGASIIRSHDVDLVYFSTTMFPTMALGRLWKRQFGVPYVLDMQDPWVSDYYEDKPKSERPPKYELAQRMHRLLEPWTMRQVDGIIAVTDEYHATLRKRYPWIPPERCRTIPFGAAAQDYEVTAGMTYKNAYFNPEDGLIHGVYAGVLGRVMRPTCEAICLALKSGLQQYPDIFSRLRLHFIGTNYATGDRATPTIQPIAKDLGIDEYVQEDPHRVPYFTVLRLLQEADFLLVPGSDNPNYTPSKIYPYILAKKPLLAVFHTASSVIDVLRTTGAGEIVTFSSGDDVGSIAQSLLPTWTQFLGRLPFEPQTDWEAFEPYTAREMTRRQCELFDDVMAACETTRAHVTT